LFLKIYDLRFFKTGWKCKKKIDAFIFDIDQEEIWLLKRGLLAPAQAHRQISGVQTLRK